MIPLATLDGTEVALAALALAATLVGAIVVLVKFVVGRRGQERDTRTREVSARLPAAGSLAVDGVALGRLEGRMDGMHGEVLARIEGLGGELRATLAPLATELGKVRRQAHDHAGMLTEHGIRLGFLERRHKLDGPPPEGERRERPKS